MSDAKWREIAPRSASMVVSEAKLKANKLGPLAMGVHVGGVQEFHASPRRHQSIGSSALA